MNAWAELWLYFLVVAGVIMLPGMDMAYVVGNSIAGGRRAGFAALAGIVAGGIVHMIICGTGLSILLKLIPGLFTGMLLLGAIYIAWTGWTLMRSPNIHLQVSGKRSRSLRQCFLGAMATCLLNPKAYVFMLAIFPQFIHPARGPLWPQVAILGLITAFAQIAIYGSLVLVAAQIQNTLSSRPDAGGHLAKWVGGVLILAAGLTAYSGITV